MRILVVGSGAREHALAWKLSLNPTVDKLFALPGNAGISGLAECLESDPADVELTANCIEDLGIDLTVVGPEVPLVAGLVDELIERGLPAFGPTKAAARIEGSKAWAKEIMLAAGAPTAQGRAFMDAANAIAYLDACVPPYVIKADGLAAGKGVVVTSARAEAVRAIEECLVRGTFGDAGATVVIEEFLPGEEMTLLCITDGRTVIPLAEAQDFKRAQDDDRGPNTGGMGAFSPVPHLPRGTVERAVHEIVEPVVAQMEKQGARFSGLLYAGLAITDNGPKTIEFNCRFGDPETEAVLPRFQSDLAELLLACVEGNLSHYTPAWSPKACVTVMLASGGYPGHYEIAKEIRGLNAVSALPDVQVFHAGTALRDGRVVTAGGRVLAVSALGADLSDARERAYEAAAIIEFDGKFARTDIAARAAMRQSETGGNS